MFYPRNDMLNYNDRDVIKFVSPIETNNFMDKNDHTMPH